MIDGLTARNILQIVESSAQQFGDKPYLLFSYSTSRVEQACEELSFSELAKTVRQAARFFVNEGVRPGDRVALHMRSCIDFIVCLFGIAACGAIAVPVNDQSAPDEVRYVLKKTTPCLVICEHQFLSMYETFKKQESPFISRIIPGRCLNNANTASSFRSEIASFSSAEFESPSIHECDTAEILFTSGTTAHPKGVELSHANLIYAAYYTQWQTSMRFDDCVLTPMPACHSNFQLAALMPSLVSGARLVLLSKYSATKFWKQVCTYKATIIQCVSMMVRTLLMQPVHLSDSQSAVREVLYFLPLDTQTKEAFERRFNVRLMNSYGSTETVTWAITDYPSGERRWPSIGRVGLGYEAKIVNSQGQEVLIGTIGEILIKGTPGRSIMKGYYNDPEHTHEALSPDGWLRTGDKGWVDQDGFFFFADRKANMIKRCGENISTVEIEDVLLNSGFIEEAAVIGEDDQIRDQVVCAFVVPRNGYTVTPAMVIDYCAQHLSSFKVPGIVEIRDSLPHTCSMKVEKRLLKTRHCETGGGDER